PPLPEPTVVVAPPSTTLTKSPPFPGPAPTGVVVKPGSGPFACPAGMVGIAGGTFEPTPYYSGTKKKPRTIVPFAMDATEVTVREYAKCIGSKKCKEPNEAFDKTSAPFCNWLHPKGRANPPINCVAFDEAATFCKAVGKRLPFAEEWEFAARGGTKGTPYPWG